jgi:hypothetical protein
MKRRHPIVLEHHVRPRSSAIGLFVLAICSALLCACGSSGPAKASSQELQGVCQDISAVLSDGPDPSADPVGYALAQVKPLRQIQTSDMALRAAIDDLASAYERVVTTKDSASAKQGVAAASDKIDAICPGAA